MPKLFPTWSRHSTETGELLRSSVDLIHYDCYTNGINKGKIAILKQNFHPLHLANLIAFLLFLHSLCVCVCALVGVSECVCVLPPCNITIRSSLFSRLGVQCRWIATFCTVKNNNMSFEIWLSAIFDTLYSPAGPGKIHLTSLNTISIKEKHPETSETRGEVG